jgi:hypothetical protein
MLLRYKDQFKMFQSFHVPRPGGGLINKKGVHIVYYIFSHE